MKIIAYDVLEGMNIEVIEMEISLLRTSPEALAVKNCLAMQETQKMLVQSPGPEDRWSGRSPGGENGNPFQYSCLENPMDRGAQWATVHGATRSRT